MALLEISAQPMNCHADAIVCSGANCVFPPSNFKAVQKQILGIVLNIMLAFVMFAMGCTVELHKLLRHLRRPWGIVIGFLCQFGIMPFTGFALSLVFNVLPVHAVVIIILGSCPGGSASNIACYYLDGDMDLSVSMTTLSTILALGMLPFSILLYTTLWVSSDTIQIPFVRIGITLVTLIVPVAFGIYVKHRWPQKAEKIVKIGSIIGYVTLAAIAVSGGILYKSSWDVELSIWVIGMLFPFIGCGLGFIIAYVIGQPWYRCRTIAMETGFQNIGLCNTIVQLSFSPAEVEVMYSFPLIYLVFEILMAFLIIGSYQLYKRKCLCCRSKAASVENDGAENGQQNGGFELSVDSVEKDQDKDTQF